MTPTWDQLERILQKIRSERIRQATIHPDKDWSDTMWLGILTEEVLEVSNEVVKSETLGGTADRARLGEELTQVAAVCCAWMEWLQLR